MRLFLTILASLFLTDCFCQTASATGYVFDKTTHKPIAETKVSLHIKSSNIVVDSTITDSTGRFVFQFIKKATYYLPCFYKMPIPNAYFPKEWTGISGRSDFDSSFTAMPESGYHHTFYLLVSCPFDKTKDLDYCPNCGKKDMIQPIFWGLPAFDINGNSSKPENYYPGGCSPDLWCNPTKHCQHCNIEF